VKQAQRATITGLHASYDKTKSIADRALPRLPHLQTELRKYEHARENLDSRRDGSPYLFKQAFREFERAERDLTQKLVEQLGNAGANDLDLELYEMLEARKHDITDQACLVVPQSYAQLLAHRFISSDVKLGHESKRPWMTICQARSVLEPANGRLAAENEAEYFRSLHPEFVSLKAAERYYRLLEHTLPDAERAVWRDLEETLSQLPAFASPQLGQTREQIVGQEEAALRANPQRYTDGPRLLATAKQQAAALSQLTAARLEAEVDRIDGIPDPMAKREAAADFLSANTDSQFLRPGMLAMRQSHQLKLLAALRAGSGKLDGNERILQSRVYKSMQLDPAFVAREDQVRGATVENLMRDPKVDLQRARNEWPALTDDKKLKVIRQVVAAHCKAGGFPQPAKIGFERLESSTIVAEYRPRQRALVINSSPAALEDFESTMNTIFHENSHNWQAVMAVDAQRNHPAVAADNPWHQQSMVFAANLADYDGDAADAKSAYREQPVEAHAMYAGPRFARDLMRALDA
jgi:hypothetical protein